MSYLGVPMVIWVLIVVVVVLYSLNVVKWNEET